MPLKRNKGRIAQYAIRPLSMLKRCLKHDYGVSGALVAHAHGIADLLQGFVGEGVGFLVAFGEHVAHVIHILGEFLATGAMRLEEAVHRFDHIRLQRARTGIADLLGDLLRITTGDQTGGCQQCGNLRTCDRIERDATLGIGRTLLDELGGDVYKRQVPQPIRRVRRAYAASRQA